MPKKKAPQDLSVEELRWLLIEKRRVGRQERLDNYRKTGRAVRVVSDANPSSMEDWHTGTLTDQDDNTATLPPPARRKRFWDGLLLLVEVCAVIGFVYILFNGLSLMQALNREVVAVLEQPTLTPTPAIVALVLPSGHIPPNAPGGARFNEAEIPEHLRPLVQSMYSAPLPTSSPEQPIRIQAPAINVDAPIVQGDGYEQLKKGVGHHINSANPGEPSNVVLSAHNDIFGEIFRDLDRLRPGDLVILYTNQRSYTYIVVNSKIVEPTNVEVMAPSTQAQVTLISCYPYLKDTQRIVITARLQPGGN